VNKIFDYIKETAKAKGMELLINNPSDFYQTGLSYFYQPD
jgi:hypothetical protein